MYVIQVTLLMTARSVELPQPPDLPKLYTFLERDLEGWLTAATAYLSNRSALTDPQSGETRKEIADLEEAIRITKDRVMDLEVPHTSALIPLLPHASRSAPRCPCLT